MNTDEKRERLMQAMQKLGDVLADIVQTAEEKNRERCGYRAASSVCTFIGGCVNRQGDKCGGDEFVKKERP